MILNTSRDSWGQLLTNEDIDKWLNNFSGGYFKNTEVEKRIALWLLLHFAYYSKKEIEELCKDVYRKFIHNRILIDNKSKENSNIVSEILCKTLFIGVGNPSESGNYLLYHFRQINNLPRIVFEPNINIKYDCVVYIDDVSISGEQAKQYLENSAIYKANNTYFLSLFITSKAERRINHIKNRKIKVLSSMYLDERDQAFSRANYMFATEELLEIKDEIKKFCEFYGKMAVDDGYMKEYPLGFDDGQYLIGFEHNIPDNTLPIFWGDSKDWVPLFKRKKKINEIEEYKIDEHYYY